MSARRNVVPYFRMLATLVVLALCLAPIASTTTSVVAQQGNPPNVPYDLPVQLPPAGVTSPEVDPNAPYTPVVLSLLAQLELSNPPTEEELANAATLLVFGSSSNLGGGVPGCYGTGPVKAPTGTTPSIEQLCWADAQGVLLTNGKIQYGTTAPMTLMGLAASFNLALGNIWGQTAGKEARWYMVTGIYGPQGDTDITPNWGRNLTTTGEDPFLSEKMVAAQVDGMQGVGAMSQMKHYAVYNGQNGNTTYQDQWLHEIGLPPYEGGYVLGKAAAAMCSYQASQNLSTHLPGPISSLWPDSPFATGDEPTTWPLNEMHFSCEQPLLLNYVLREQWNSNAFVATDYGAMHSTSAIFQGTDQEMPSRNYYSTTNPYGTGTGGPMGSSGFNPTGSTCADPVTGLQASCSVSGTIHVSGIPSGTACPLDATGGGGCGLVKAVRAGTVPLSVFNQAMARILYQEERFGLLGCSDNPVSTLCTNPGGNGTTGGDKPGTGTRTGQVMLPDGPTTGIPVIGTKNGDAAIVEKYSEMGATLLKNNNNALPLTASDLAGGILVTGASANHTVADPTGEASTGMLDRNAVNPLQQLKALSGNASAFTFIPANDPTGQPVPPSVLSTSPDASGLGGLMLSIDGGDPTKDTTPIDHTALNGNQLAPNHTYTWSGYLYVPITDTYSFAFQQSDTLPTSLNCPQTGQYRYPATSPTMTLCSPFTTANYTYTNIVSDAVKFSFDGVNRNLNAVTANIYGATVPSNPTNAGYTDPLLVSRTCATGATATEPGTTNCAAAQSNLLGGTFHPITITVDTHTCLSTPPAAPVTSGGFGAPATVVAPEVPAVLAPCGSTSFRFAYSRTNGDITDAAAAAVGKSKAIVFVNDGVGTTSTITNPYGANPATIAAPISLSKASTDLINAVAAANPNTIVVLNNANPVLTPWIGNARALLAMWFAGQEGGTSTARLLLGQANPSGHTAITWPKNATDTIWGYNQPEPLYPGDTTGPHLERYGQGGGPAGGGSASLTQGIYSGYRYFDQMGIQPQFPFGHGLSYTKFSYSNLKLTPTADGGMDVVFDLRNSGTVAGAEVPQVYVGPGRDVPGVQQAVRSLRGFDRIELNAGETKHITIHLDKRSFQYWDEVSQQWKTLGGQRTIEVGSSSRDIRLSNTATPFSSFIFLPLIVR